MAATQTIQQQKPSAYSVCPPILFKPLRMSPMVTSSKPSYYSSFLPLHSVLPKHFTDMYTPDVLENKALLTPAGRPLFTKRTLVDWVKNDTRSLLIVESLRPEWNNKLPQIIEPGYRVQVLGFDATDEELIEGLVSSDIYMEMEFEPAFLTQTAQYTVQAARARHPTQSSAQPLTKPEWRNIIENYLLNLACEAQCRLDFKKSCSYLKRHKLYQLEQQDRKVQQKNQHSSQQQSPQQLTTPNSNKSTSPLLKKAILTSLSTSPDFPSVFLSNNNSYGEYMIHQQQKKSVSLTRFEKQKIWVQVQTDLYARLGLNWEADELV